jgi:histidine phosphotransferase ChpT
LVSVNAKQGPSLMTERV